jgi:hypothetical protein
METISGLHKTECVRTTVFHDGPCTTTTDVEYTTTGWGRLVRRLTADDSTVVSGRSPRPNPRPTAHDPQQRATPRTEAAPNPKRFSF